MSGTGPQPIDIKFVSETAGFVAWAWTMGGGPQNVAPGVELIGVIAPGTYTMLFIGGLPSGTTGSYEASITAGAPLSETPLPAALPLFVTGLGAMGLLGWRRKRKDAAVAA